ncbi:MAG: zinc ribbon domain-containing protein [Desulfobacteraceae bacterium]|nr:MAG: zinc ribbon domain-containing protein [Desulfobacteraceae bacterium]
MKCLDCGYTGEVLLIDRAAPMQCPSCGSQATTKLMSAPSSLTGRSGQHLPGPQDTACCGSHPGQAAACAGPGSCCGRR